MLPPGSNEQKIGDFYASCMDEKDIDAAGVKPLEAEFARINSVASTAELQAEIAQLQNMGVRAPFDFGSTPDAKNSSEVIGGADQAGLGLPDRDYYTKTDEKSKQLVQQYQEHMLKMLVLAGDEDGKASSEAKSIVELETKLAEASMTTVDRRDPEKTYHRMSRGQTAGADSQLGLGRLTSRKSATPTSTRWTYPRRIFCGREQGIERYAPRNLEKLPALAAFEFIGGIFVPAICGRKF